MRVGKQWRTESGVIVFELRFGYVRVATFSGINPVIWVYINFIVLIV